MVMITLETILNEKVS